MMTSDPYVIRKNGAFYRPNRQGYTNHVVSAGLYTKEEADAEHANCPECEGVPLTTFKDELIRNRDTAQAALNLLLENTGEVDKPYRREVWATCAHCSWTWAVYAPLPAPVEVVAKAMKLARCPHCSKRPGRIYMASDTDIKDAIEKAAT